MLCSCGGKIVLDKAVRDYKCRKCGKPYYNQGGRLREKDGPDSSKDNR